MRMRIVSLPSGRGASRRNGKEPASARPSLYKKDAGQLGRRLFYSLLRSDSSALDLAPESRERRTVRRLTQLLERPLADLSDPLTGDAHQRADLFERHRVGALFEAVIEVKDLPLAWGEVLSKNAIDELAHQMEVRHVLDLGAIHSGETLSKRAGLAIRAIDWGIERDFRRRHLLGGTNRVGCLFEQTADLVVGGIAI